MPKANTGYELQPGHRYALTSRQTVIGRDGSCDFVIPIVSVSRRHGRITCDPDGCCIEDLGSRNGTFVNSERVFGQRPLNDGDVIDLDVVTLKYISPKDGEPPCLLVPDKSFPTRTRQERREAFSPDAPLPPNLTVIKAPTVLSPEISSVADSDLVLRGLGCLLRHLGDAMLLDDVLPRTLDALFELFPNATRGYVLLADEPNMPWVPRAVKFRPGVAEHSMTVGPLSRTLATRVLTNGEAILSRDAVNERATDAAQQVLESGLRTVLCAPLPGTSDRPFGIVYLESQDSVRPFAAWDLHLLVSLLPWAGRACGITRAVQAHVQLDRREREFHAVREIRRRWLLPRPPIVPGYRVESCAVPASSAGSVDCSAWRLPDGRLALLAVEIEGSSQSEVLTVAWITSEMRRRLAEPSGGRAPLLSPAEAIRQLDRDLFSVGGREVRVKLLVAVLDPETHELTVANAGHAPLWCLSRKNPLALPTPLGEGPSEPLGGTSTAVLSEAQWSLAPGDAFFVGSEGFAAALGKLTEAGFLQVLAEALVTGAPEMASGDTTSNEAPSWLLQSPENQPVAWVCCGRTLPAVDEIASS